MGREPFEMRIHIATDGESLDSTLWGECTTGDAAFIEEALRRNPAFGSMFKGKDWWVETRRRRPLPIAWISGFWSRLVERGG